MVEYRIGKQLVLREMMDKNSPVYLQNPDPGCIDARITSFPGSFPKSLETEEDIDVSREKGLVRQEVSVIASMFSVPTANDEQQEPKKRLLIRKGRQLLGQ